MDQVNNTFDISKLTQKENVYNKLLPYAAELEEESTALFNDIKTNLIKAVLAREIWPGCMIWTSRFNKYRKIYGLKFSREDHIMLVKLYFELVTIPSLEPARINEFAATLHSLLKKKIISPQELQLQWKPLYNVRVRILEKSKIEIGMYKYMPSLETVLDNMVQACRIYFPVEATQEILDELRPKLYPSSKKETIRALRNLELLLPIVVEPEKRHLGYELWLAELMYLWKNCNNTSMWENHLTWLVARLASYNTGYINWEPYTPIMFGRFRRALHLPVNYRKTDSVKDYNIDCSAMAMWIVQSLGGSNNTTFFHLEKLMHTLQSYYHSANTGRWTSRICELLKKLASYFVQRVRYERVKKLTWELSVPDHFKLTDSDIEHFINIMQPCLEQAMFSRQGNYDISEALQCMASLRSDLVVPIVLDKLYLSLDNLTEPHKLTSSMMCTLSVARFMVQGAKNNYPDGPTHVFPLLTALLPGIDTNDIRKCLMTFNLISYFSVLAPLVNSSEAGNYYSDLTEQEIIVCAASAGVEDFVLQFFDQICTWVGSNSLEFTRMEQNDNDRKSKLETICETALSSVVTAVLHQCSSEIYEAALRKVYNFVTNNILEIKISGKLVAILCHCFAKTNSEVTLKLFVPKLCDAIENLLGENGEAEKEERLNDELLYNLLILSEIVDGRSELLNYIGKINNVLEKTLHLNCIQGSRLACHMLQVIMTSLSLIQPTEFRSCNRPYSNSVQEFLTVREWGESGNKDNLGITWYTPGNNEIHCMQEFLNKYLVPELEVLDHYVTDKATLSRKELRRCLKIINAVLACQSILPQWEEPEIELLGTVLDPWKFKIITGNYHTVKMPNGQNIRKAIAITIHQVQKKLLETDEGDTHSILEIIKIFDVLLLNKLPGKDFDTRWKSFHIKKKILEDKLHKSKNHLRHILIDHALLQHEQRSENHFPSLTKSHQQIILDLFELSVSTYSEVRISAQNKLFAAIATFPYSYLILIPHIKQILQMDTTKYHEKFKGCLYVLIGSKSAILVRHDWNIIKEIWPLLVKSKPSEKPSIVKLMSAVLNSIRWLPTISIISEIPDRCLKAGYEFAKYMPQLVEDFKEKIEMGKKQLTLKNNEKIVNYDNILNELLDVCQNGNLHWRHHLMAVSIIKELVHTDVKYNPNIIKYFLKSLINDSIQIRKIALRVLLFVLLQNKPVFRKVVIDPLSFSGNKEISHAMGIRLDNVWLLYNNETAPRTAVEWDKLRYLHRQDYGYYAWPKHLEVYASSSDQPLFSKRLRDCTEQEKEILNFFNEENINILIKYLSMEEKNGNDKFNLYRCLLFKNLFKNFDDHFLPLLIPHLERLIKDTCEANHRCAAEIISGIIGGSKHWNYEKIEQLWIILIPILRTAFSNITIETLEDWGVCFAMALNSRDPNRHHWLLELLMEIPINKDATFNSCCRLYILQCALKQQPWRNVELFNRLLENIKNHLSHPFQNVRDGISSILTQTFCEDFRLSNKSLVQLPNINDFFLHIINKLNVFYETIISSSNIKDQDDDMKENFQLQNLGADKLKDEATHLYKTIIKCIIGGISKGNFMVILDYYQLLPLTCVLQSNESDDELVLLCSNFLAVMARTLVMEEYLPNAITTIQQVSNSPLWSARSAISEFIPVFVFHNFASIVSHKKLVLKMQAIVLTLLEDSQVEVRVKAGKTLSGFLHCCFIPDKLSLLATFKEKAKITKNIGKSSNKNNFTKQSLPVKHAAILGMCAFVNSHPYDVPNYLPDVFVELGQHLNDPQPIPGTIRETLGNFKRTHHDNWDIHKLKFTDDELFLLSDLTVPPSYYA